MDILVSGHWEFSGDVPAPHTSKLRTSLPYHPVSCFMCVCSAGFAHLKLYSAGLFNTPMGSCVLFFFKFTAI